MPFQITAELIAPIPVGHRVQILKAQRWMSEMFSSTPSWQDVSSPIITDLDTGIVYVSDSMANDITLGPINFKPNTGYRFAQSIEGRVTQCLVSCHAGDHARMQTMLVIEQTPQGYRT